MAITWLNPIKGYLAPSAAHMKQVTGGAIDLSSYISVKTNLSDIWDQISSKSMPPGGGWPDNQIADFKAWMDAGTPMGATADAPDHTPMTNAPTANTITWTNTIQKYLSGYAVTHMKQVTGGNLDLSSYDDVKSQVKSIWLVIHAGEMPPGGWPQKKRDDFQAWMAAGCPK
jgi:hypothetical protein